MGSMRLPKDTGGAGGFFLACEDLGKGSTIDSPPALFIVLSGDQLTHTNNHFFRPESVHSGSANWGDCGRVFSDDLRVNSFPWEGG